MEANACLEFPSDCQNITFNLLFVFMGTYTASQRTWSPSILPTKEVNELFDIRVILGTVGGSRGI